jgi:NADH-ubiquinone oxidoreductase chain 4
MFNRIAFAGSYFKQLWDTYLPDINKREYTILLSLVLFTIILGIYPAIILDGLHYSTYCVLYSISSFDTVNFDTLFSDYELICNQSIFRWK